MIRKLWPVLLLTLSGAAFASSCPLLMQDIDAALQDQAVVEQLSEEELAEVRQLREEGEAAHEAGDHGRSMEKLAQAKGILGIS